MLANSKNKQEMNIIYPYFPNKKTIIIKMYLINLFVSDNTEMPPVILIKSNGGQEIYNRRYLVRNGYAKWAKNKNVFNKFVCK